MTSCVGHRLGVTAESAASAARADKDRCHVPNELCSQLCCPLELLQANLLLLLLLGV
jgi:hypothetical protein